MAVGMIGRKVGMMRLYDGGGRVRAVTAIELGPNRITQLRTDDRDGYQGVQVGGRGKRKRLTRPQRGHLRRAGVDEPFGELREVRTSGEVELALGQELRVDQFEPGEFVDVSATSKGRGFAGVVKRWGFKGGPKSHGQTDKHRGSGSIGAGTTPGRVWKGQKMGGHMGARRKTVRNLLVVLTDLSRNLLMVEGSVPGPNGAIVVVNPARRLALADFQPPPPLPSASAPSEDGEAQPDAAPEDEAIEDATDAADAADAADATDAADAADTAEGAGEPTPAGETSEDESTE